MLLFFFLSWYIPTIVCRISHAAISREQEMQAFLSQIRKNRKQELTSETLGCVWLVCYPTRDGNSLFSSAAMCLVCERERMRVARCFEYSPKIELREKVADMLIPRVHAPR